MIIQYYGGTCFKITTKPLGRATDDVNIFFDPHTGTRAALGATDLIFLTHGVPDYYAKPIGRGEPTVIDTPGEYALSGTTVVGVDAFSDAVGGSENGLTTLFSFLSEDISVCHLGTLGQAPTSEQLERIGSVDILLLGVCSRGEIDAKKASAIAHMLEPKIVIPMDYSSEGKKGRDEALEAFCGVVGNCPSDTLPRLTVKAKDLEGQSMQVVLLDVEQS
ncbi:MAG: MBL fold metallo-hydrolase [Candidatus Moranbacteria bacterium]|nr:MBL fold metallo-hydrolase [Candidatus Moranbacteria bacterium]